MALTAINVSLATASRPGEFWKGHQSMNPDVDPDETAEWLAALDSVLQAAQVAHPGDLELEQRLLAMARWNAMCVVSRRCRWAWAR